MESKKENAPARGIEARTVPMEFTGSDGRTFRYRLARRDSARDVPLVVFLHGAGERGEDNARQLVHGVTELADWLDSHEEGYRLVAGQVPEGMGWVDVPWGEASHTMPESPSPTMSLLLELIDAMVASGGIDVSRIYVTGISMGGYGTWDIVCRRPGLFAAALPICGGGDTAMAPKIANVPIWAFHGSDDQAVPVCRSRKMVSALWEAGSNAHYREYPDAPHDVWTATYRDPAVLRWFFAQRRPNGS